MSISRHTAQIASILITTATLITASAGSSVAAPQSSLTAGEKCTVTSGPNKGETGTYGDDGWCEGDWGGTECVASKCKVASTSIVRGSQSNGNAIQKLGARSAFRFNFAASTLRN